MLDGLKTISYDVDIQLRVYLCKWRDGRWIAYCMKRPLVVKRWNRSWQEFEGAQAFVFGLTLE